MFCWVIKETTSLGFSHLHLWEAGDELAHPSHISFFFFLPPPFADRRAIENGSEEQEATPNERDEGGEDGRNTTRRGWT